MQTVASFIRDTTSKILLSFNDKIYWRKLAEEVQNIAVTKDMNSYILSYKTGISEILQRFSHGERNFSLASKQAPPMQEPR
jgi:hypothetical protein